MSRRVDSHRFLGRKSNGKAFKMELASQPTKKIYNKNIFPNKQ